MMKQFSLTLAAAVCLVGCSKQDESATDTKKSDSSAAAASTAKTPTAPTTASTSPAPSASPATAPATAAPAAEWKTTASGLKYQVLKKGTGTVSPKATDTVVVNYTGSLTN